MPLVHVLVAFAEVFLPVMAILVVLIVTQDLPELRARAHQRRIAAAEVHGRKLEEALSQARTHLATLQRAKVA